MLVRRGVYSEVVLISKCSQSEVPLYCLHASCSLFPESGALYTWGWNEYGQLCQGDTVTRDAPTRVTLDDAAPVTDIICGAWNTVIITQADVKEGERT